MKKQNASNGTLSPEEVTQISAFEKKIASIDGHFQATRLDSSLARSDEALNRYISDPSQKNWDAFEKESVEYESLRKMPKLQQAVDHALNRLAEEVRPFLTPVIERLQTRAENTLASVIETESKRHFELTGIEQSFASKAIEEARKPVQDLEEIHRHVFSQDSQAIKKALAALKNYSSSVE
jgi:hypothetical protein